MAPTSTQSPGKVRAPSARLTQRRPGMISQAALAPFVEHVVDYATSDPKCVRNLGHVATVVVPVASPRLPSGLAASPSQLLIAGLHYLGAVSIAHTSHTLHAPGSPLPEPVPSRALSMPVPQEVYSMSWTPHKRDLTLVTLCARIELYIDVRVHLLRCESSYARWLSGCGQD
jgi:hypothetical protein